MPPPGAVLAVVLLAWAAGTAVFAAATRLMRAVQPGHFKVCWLVVAALAAGASGAGGWTWEAGVLAGLALVTFAAIYVHGADAVLGPVTAAAGVAVVVWTAPLFALAAAWLLGAVTNAMLLGHWHLNQPRLGTGPLRRLVWALWAGTGVFVACAAAVAASGPGVDMLGGGTAAAFAAFSAVLTAMVTHLVRTRSIMSATGILYLEVLLCFVAAFTGVLGALA